MSPSAGSIPSGTPRAQRLCVSEQQLIWRMTMKTISKTQDGVKVIAGVKADEMSVNHARKLLTLKIKTGIKAAGLNVNHTRKLLTLKITTGIKAGEGIVSVNHNRRLT
jgi:hypothetical protein